MLELMIVIVIIGILISIFTLSVGSYSDDQTTEHARRLQALVDLAMEEAVMQGREIGLRFYQHGYEFSLRVPQVTEDGLQFWAWLPLEDGDDRLLKPRNFGDEYAVDLMIEGKEVDLDYKRGEEDDDEEYQPQIYLFSSGDLAPAFTVRIRPEFSNEAILVKADVEGKTELTDDDF